MNKAELLKSIMDSGQENTFRATAEWAAAFKAYNLAMATNKEMKCGACFREVLKWLRS